MDSTLLGVIIGSGLALAGNAITQYFALRKDRAHWKFQKESEDAVWQRNEQKAEKELLRETYQHSLLALSVFIAIESESVDSNTDRDKRRQYIGDIQEWATMLLIRHTDERLAELLTNFTDDPEIYGAQFIYNRVLELIKREQGFFLNEISGPPESIPKKVETAPSLRHVTFNIDSDFRKAALVKGLDLPQSSSFKIELNQISESQRNALADVYFASYRTIPTNLNLSLPDYRDGWPDINFRGQPWLAKLNPLESDPETALKAWESDFQVALTEATRKRQGKGTD